MIYTNVKNPVWNIDKTAIDCIVDFENIGEVPFTAAPVDLPHSVEIYNRCIAGEFGPVAEHVPLVDVIQPFPSIPLVKTGEIL